MKEQDLFSAIGGVEDRFLEELEQPAVSRLPRHFGLIAAILALLLTACAAPAIIRNFRAVKVGSIVESDQDLVWEEIWSDSQGHVLKVDTDRFSTSKTVSLEVAVSPDAPQTIETRYIPLKLLDYCTIEDVIDEETIFSLALSMNLPKAGRSSGILFQQHVLTEDGSMKIEGVLDRGLWETESKTYGDISVLEISGDVFYSGSKDSSLVYTKHLFWSDGYYLYCLKIPITYPLNITKVEEILTSLTAVEDITEYSPLPEA